MAAPTTTRLERQPSVRIAVGGILARQPRARNIVLLAFAGRAKSLVSSGSAAFRRGRACRFQPATLAAYLNFDMVGRMQDNKLSVQASGTSQGVGQDHRAGQREGRLQPAACSLIRISRPTSPRSATAECAVAELLHRLARADYHKPSDTADKIDYADLDRIVDFAAAIARRVEDAPEAPVFAKVEPQTQGGARRAQACACSPARSRTTPSDAKGLLLGGCRRWRAGGSRGPAEGRRHHRDRRPDRSRTSTTTRTRSTS